MNQPLPRERVAAPARNIHLQNNSFPCPQSSQQMLSPGPQRGGRSRRWGGGGDHSPPPHHHCPRLQPTPRPQGGRCGSGDPGRAEAHSVEGSPGGEGGRRVPGAGVTSAKAGVREHGSTGPGLRPQPSPGTHRSGRHRPPRSPPGPAAAAAIRGSWPRPPRPPPPLPAPGQPQPPSRCLRDSAPAPPTN